MLITEPPQWEPSAPTARARRGRQRPPPAPFPPGRLRGSECVIHMGLLQTYPGDLCLHIYIYMYIISH